MLSDAETKVILSAVEGDKKTNRLPFFCRNNSLAASLTAETEQLKAVTFQKTEQKIKLTAKSYLNLVTEKDTAVNPRDVSAREGFRCTHPVQ